MYLWQSSVEYQRNTRYSGGFGRIGGKTLSGEDNHSILPSPRGGVEVTFSSADVQVPDFYNIDTAMRRTCFKHIVYPFFKTGEAKIWRFSGSEAANVAIMCIVDTRI